MAMRCPHAVAKRTWCDPVRLEEEMRMQGMSRKFVDDVIRQLKADEQLVHGYLSGRLTLTTGDLAAALPAGNLAT